MTREYDLSPKQAWRLARKLLTQIKYEDGCDEATEWVYASTESDKHISKFEAWLGSKNIPDQESIWIMVKHPAEDTIDMSWGDFTKRWSEFLSDSDIKIVSKSFEWVLEYMPEGVARFGRKA